MCLPIMKRFFIILYSEDAIARMMTKTNPPGNTYRFQFLPWKIDGREIAGPVILSVVTRSQEHIDHLRDAIYKSPFFVCHEEATDTFPVSHFPR